MKNILYLTKILFLNNFGVNFSKKAKTKTSSNKGFIFLIILLLGIVSIPMAIVGFSIGAGLKYVDITGDDLILIYKMILPIASILIVFFSIFSIISTFFLANDTEILLGLPLKPSEIIIAKFLNSLSSIYLIELMLLTPILLGIGVGAFLHPIYYLNVLLVSIFLPFVPLSILGIIITSLMRYSAISKMKDKIQYFIMIFAIIFAIGIQFLSQSSASSLEGSEEEILLALESFPNIISNIMFFTYPASISLGSSNILISILSIISFIIISLGSLVLFAFVSGKIYIKGILGRPQLKTKKFKKEKIELSENKDSIFKTLIKNEWKMMWRSPVYNMNLISTVLVVPLIFAISFAFGFINGTEGMNFNEVFMYMSEILNFESGYSIVFAIAVLSFFTCFSPIAATAISRDGKNAWTNKVIPLPTMTIINSKVFWGIVLGYLPVIFITLIGTILGIFTILEFFLINIPIFLLVIFTNYIGISIDLVKPKLEWDNENTAVKQNINMFYFMLIDWALTIIIAGIGVLFIFINIPAFLASIILTLIFGVSCVIIYKSLNKKGLALFKNIG